MLDLKLLQNNPEVVAEALAKRNSGIDITLFTALDQRRRELLLEVEALKSERNKASGDVARMKRAGENADALIEKLGALSDRIKTLDAETETVKAEVHQWLISLPNIPHESVPAGADENDNVFLHAWGEKPSFDFTPKEHWEIGPALGLDFERGSRLTGSRFTVLWHWAAKLERALTAFFLDVHTREHGYMEVYPPAMVNAQTMTGTGQLPKFEEDLFKLRDSEYYLIPTAEVPLTNLHSGEVVPEEKLPIAYTAQTQCFRSEAGSYGKDTKGFIRQHQFTKVEMVRFAHPEKSFEELEKLRSHAEVLLQKLGLHYRVVTLCSGDMGFSAAKTYDLEVWLPGQDKYREISSCSNCTDFQARRANIRTRLADAKKPVFLHTLNGSGLAVGRTLVAILENYQQADGSVVVPEVLRPYMGGVALLTPDGPF
ncbi:seryl-tRNA synthetase [Oleidesulfovibrio alaskensis G20]|jgi:seryl-tRNA synthetase|uniref:Serine--tRNA ligase n=1 Tax=Oleidesulfovibrio alaskensis (strain ATCC BAA-1058 / DSM 17464 / G20) TaxID=207559 RepID=SYS_OLEA2|nr:serine--tRNA ligase [Oleidesulfovibrio alaskensis]Q316Z9.1 RecName: Full=Serine--tRNA ligase; AltName: Full=Seryl-tRNA synthetase; Short=SerRS; AltName: Full=Seryl-tRNA(Ser/Sec) synthetase [Oleidesulfovibrio alaskensis G20]ABB36997.1 seryl-tRNA synthetase [Oleidesulfovibrio alaskensis G20]MBG0774514.1 serine--tRNA ligase [Oleidesulfovibrio alaskensis]MBL3582817.1 serine--tRNA ligase [Oleidesulfovibrio alaskensis]